MTDVLDWNGDNVIAVWADNSDDPSYPPGKAQDELDYTYFGSIYRDCWLIAHNNVFITDPNYENEVAGGGLFVAFGKVSDALAEVQLKIHVRNATKNPISGRVEYMLLQPDGTEVARLSDKIQVKVGRATTVSDRMPVKQPMLWTPSTPTLYNLLVRVLDKEGNVIDGYRRRIGIRSIEFKGKDGFYLNGRPYGKPLIGANRHQDFAVVGNAVANSIHWRDAKKLKDVGMEIIRNAHCPQDPAFMDACDELGLFVIVNTPGWQFWNDAPEFAQRVYSDIRNVVRRDRNHPSVWLWEPILNETWYPADFAKNTRDIVDAEYPYPYCYSGSDSEARGHENFPVYFAHPANMQDASKEIDPTKTYFTREWGDNVDDWSSHNSPSRVARNWGEQPMRVQAQHYACPYYPVTSYDVLYKQSPQHVGGCLWHSFDHQRGYHPDPFYGGLMDVFRQPKYSYYMFMAQRSPEKSDLIADIGPMIYIAQEITPISPTDVTVYSNCEEIRLTVFKGGKEYVYKKDPNHKGMPSPIITFKDVYHFMEWKAMARAGKQDDAYLLAEGLIGGEVVVSHKRYPSGQADHLVVRLDNENVSLKADGSDIVTVIAEVVDKRGTVKRLNNSHVRFDIQGEGRLLGDASVGTNPAPVIWGSAPVLVQSTTKPGKVRIIASMQNSGQSRPLEGILEFETVANDQKEIFLQEELLGGGESRSNMKKVVSKSDLERENERLRKELNQLKVKEVEKQQTQFGVGIND